MIKHSSGMALCLKYVANRIPSLAPLIARRPHASVHRQKHSFASSFVRECRGDGDISPSSDLCNNSSLGHFKNPEKILSLKCDSDVIRYFAYLIFESSDKHTTQSKRSKNDCQCGDDVVGVPYRGTPDDFKLNDICDFKSSFSLQKNRRLKESVLQHSAAEVQNYAPSGDQEDLNLQSVRNNSTSGDTSQRPSEEQLAHVHQTLANDLPYFFSKPLDFKIYHPNIEFEDNIRGKKFFGRNDYYVQAKLLYVIGHLRFMYIKLDVMKITSHPEDGTIKVRWKISVLRLRKLYRSKAKNFLKSLQKANETWIDGFSTYYVMGDGLVHKHVADKMMPDPEQLLKKSGSPKTVPVPHPLAYSDRNKM